MSNNKVKEKHPENKNVTTENGFIEGEAYPNCDGEPCANVADDDDNSAPQAEDFKKQAEEWKDKYMRLSAEFDNYRKRTLKEKMDLITSGGEDIIKAMLTVVDDMDRALAALEVSTDVEAVKKGVELISQKLGDTLRAKGVSEIEALGKELDTDLHEAVAKIPAPDKEHSGKILDVVQKGYKLKDKVIRYAKVVVGE